MNGQRRFQLALLAVILVACVIWSYVAMASSCRKALEAKQSLEEVGRCALAIENCRQCPTLAADRERLAGEMTGLIEKHASEVGISAAKLARISPEPPQYLSDTAYKEKPTQVALRGVTLEQVVRLSHALCAADAGLNIKSLRLTPAAEGSPTLWSAEIVLTYLIYSPRSVE